MKIDFDKVEDYAPQLERFKGFIPHPLELYIDVIKRDTLLKSQGLFDIVLNEEMEYRSAMKISEDKFLFVMKQLELWVNKNPQFKDILT